MSANRIRPTWFGMKGQPFPASPMPDSRGAIGVMDPSSGDDVAAICLRRSAGELEWLELALAEDIEEVMEAPPWRQSELARGVFTQIQANGSPATTFSTTGGTAPTVTTSGSSSNADTTNRGAFIQMSTSTTITTDSSVVLGAPANALITGWNPWMDLVIQASSTTTNLRVWFGLFASTPIASADPAIHGFGFRYDTSASDTTIHCWSNDGTSGGTITDLAATWTNGTNYRISAAVRGNGTIIDFYLNDTLAQSHTTNLPATTTYLGAGGYCRTLNAAAKAIRVGRFAVGYSH